MPYNQPALVDWWHVLYIILRTIEMSCAIQPSCIGGLVACPIYNPTYNRNVTCHTAVLQWWIGGMFYIQSYG